ncbi:TPA: zinc metalloprotease HtpX [Candidatus Woesearchaeota archaeon]|nr:zinc metalloprotease HtpX [Candidatus Woesearchaeota archaeon]HII68922.1 zinc metalloprotease HtpX [Candidatus Woesearchaeota archaeon]
MGLGNQFRTILLLGLLTALMLWIGSLFGAVGFYIALAMVLLFNIGSYWFSDKLVLAMYKAKEILPEQNHKLYAMVKDVAMRANLPTPKVYVIPSQSANAFATGRNPKHAAVAATEGIMHLLSDDELKGVIAHEMAHVKNRDILIATIAGTIAGVISYVASMAQWAAIFGGFGGRDNDEGGNFISLLALAIITPIIAMIIQMAISRQREYLADETGARIIKNSHGLAAALEKLERDAKVHPMRMGSSATAHLFITNPFRGRGAALMNFFSTHPPMHERIRRLRNLAI